jgi:hypothetical protein
MRLFLRELVVSAPTAGEVAGAAELRPSLLNVVDSFAVAAPARLFSNSFEHTRMLSHKEGTESSGRETVFRGQGDSGGGVHLGEGRQAVASGRCGREGVVPRLTTLRSTCLVAPPLRVSEFLA